MTSPAPQTPSPTLGSRIVAWVNSLSPAKAIWYALGAVPLLALIHLVVVAALTRHWPWDVWPVKLEQLGSYGDSIAPWTAGFAMLAALFAGLAFREQRDALAVERETARQERAHANLARFDGLAAQALTMYDDALVRLDQAAMDSNANRTGQSLLEDLQKKRLRGDIYPLDPSTATQYWTSELEAPRNQPVQRYARTVFAIIVWLDDVARATELDQNNSTKRWVRLLESRMSEAERHMLMELIDFTAPREVKAAEKRLGIFEWKELYRYTLESMTNDGRPLRTVRNDLLRVAHDLKPLLDSFAKQSPSLEGEDDAHIVVRPDGEYLTVVAGLKTYVRCRNEPLVAVLMPHAATVADYTDQEKACLIQEDKRPASDTTGTAVRDVRSHIPNAIESIWHFDANTTALVFMRTDILVLLKTGFEPDAKTVEESPRVFFCIPDTGEIRNHRTGTLTLSSLAWHQLSESYAEYSGIDNRNATRRFQAFRFWPKE